MKAMNDAAARFEQEKDVLLGVQREINCGVNMLSLPRILSCSGKERTQDIKVCHTLKAANFFTSYYDRLTLKKLNFTKRGKLLALKIALVSI